MIRKEAESAVTPAISVMLLVLMVTLLAVIMYAFIYGIPGGLAKSAYVAAEAGVDEINGTEFVVIQHRGGDAVFLNGSGAARGIPIDIRTTAACGGSMLAGADVPIVWTPGERLYLYNTAEGPKVTKERAEATACTGFPDGSLEVTVIDRNAEELVFGSTLALSGRGDTYRLVVIANPGDGGSATGSGSYREGEGVALHAGPTDGYQFINWTQNGVEIATASAFTFTMPAEDVTLVANFEQTEAPGEAPGFTVEAWVQWNRDPRNPPPAGDERWATIVVDGERDRGDRGSRYHLQHSSDNKFFQIAMTADTRRVTESITTPVEGTWYYVVGVYSQADEKLLIYVDGGDPESGTSLTGDLIPSPDCYQIGGPEGVYFGTQQPEGGFLWNDQRKFDGEIRGIHTHERALTQAEIQERYDAGRTGPDEPPNEIAGFTVEAWVQWNTTPGSPADDEQWATIVVDGTSDANRRYHLLHSRNNDRFSYAIGTPDATGSQYYVHSTTEPEVDTWYYLTGVYNQETGRLAIYVNGTSERSIRISKAGLRPSPEAYQIGGPAGIEWPDSTSMQRKFDGEIRGLGTYERALSLAEIQARYKADRPPA